MIICFFSLILFGMTGELLNDFTVSLINCNSLNMSSSTSSIQKQKLYGITKLNTDFIFLSDTRLGNKNLTSNVEALKKNFLVNPYCSYNLLYNSTKNKRGTGILVKTSINFTELGRCADPEENFLAVKATVKGKNVILCSIYGPNSHAPEFFISLFNGIRSLGNLPIVIGGDWNCTYSAAEIHDNIDCIEMAELPNSRHSRYLSEFCNDLGLIDPFRGNFPEKREYTYKPFGEARKNRSRIDFFLVSENIFPLCSDCTIAENFQSKLFDHKGVFLNIGKVKKASLKGPKIYNEIVKEKDLEYVVWAAAAETYLLHLDRNQTSVRDIETGLLLVGRVKSLLREIGPDPIHLTDLELNLQKIIDRERLVLILSNIVRDYPIEAFRIFDRAIDDDLFLEILINNIRNDVTSYQHYIKTAKKEKRKTNFTH